ncbi:hypothetical protein HELRODRAFT_159553 [Helobdella robusta]|uniref:RNA helicase n=1 Tax=Helobdella robusta TaxID=6412 RepID=T1EP56_HELRO|nr:hypothetical protein HELRODRAFT_159553 [Helobdella robusta]ESO12959.1 hypothetical protein HELRODRAFT_159553 [Helobdella robusta]
MDPLEKVEKLPNLNVWSTLCDVRRMLLDNQLADENPQHMELLFHSCGGSFHDVPGFVRSHQFTNYAYSSKGLFLPLLTEKFEITSSSTSTALTKPPETDASPPPATTSVATVATNSLTATQAKRPACKVHISAAENPCHFYVQKVENFERLKALEDELNKSVELDQVKKRDADVEWRSNMLVLAKAQEDMRWHRAKVMAVMSDEKDDNLEDQLCRHNYSKVEVEVLFVDTGITEVVVSDDLLPMTSYYKQQLPFQAIECGMMLVEPIDDDDDEDEDEDGGGGGGSCYGNVLVADNNKFDKTSGNANKGDGDDGEEKDAIPPDVILKFKELAKKVWTGSSVDHSDSTDDDDDEDDDEEESDDDVDGHHADDDVDPPNNDGSDNVSDSNSNNSSNVNDNSKKASTTTTLKSWSPDSGSFMLDASEDVSNAKLVALTVEVGSALTTALNTGEYRYSVNLHDTTSFGDYVVSYTELLVANRMAVVSLNGVKDLFKDLSSKYDDDDGSGKKKRKKLNGRTDSDNNDYDYDESEDDDDDSRGICGDDKDADVPEDKMHCLSVCKFISLCERYLLSKGRGVCLKLANQILLTVQDACMNNYKTVDYLDILNRTLKYTRYSNNIIPLINAILLVVHKDRFCSEAKNCNLWNTICFMLDRLRILSCSDNDVTSNDHCSCMIVRRGTSPSQHAKYLLFLLQSLPQMLQCSECQECFRMKGGVSLLSKILININLPINLTHLCINIIINLLEKQIGYGIDISHQNIPARASKKSSDQQNVLSTTNPTTSGEENVLSTRTTSSEEENAVVPMNSAELEQQQEHADLLKLKKMWERELQLNINLVRKRYKNVSQQLLEFVDNELSKFRKITGQEGAIGDDEDDYDDDDDEFENYDDDEFGSGGNNLYRNNINNAQPYIHQQQQPQQLTQQVYFRKLDYVDSLQMVCCVINRCIDMITTSSSTTTSSSSLLATISRTTLTLCVDLIYVVLIINKDNNRSRCNDRNNNWEKCVRCLQTNHALSSLVSLVDHCKDVDLVKDVFNVFTIISQSSFYARKELNGLKVLQIVERLQKNYPDDYDDDDVCKKLTNALARKKKEKKGTNEEKSKRPEVSWANVSDSLIKMRIEVRDVGGGEEDGCGEPPIKLEKQSIHFRAVSNRQEYSFNLQLHAEIIPEDCPIKVNSSEVNVTLVKKEPSEWPRLGSSRHSYVKYDYEMDRLDECGDGNGGENWDKADGEDWRCDYDYSDDEDDDMTLDEDDDGTEFLS